MNDVTATPEPHGRFKVPTLSYLRVSDSGLASTAFGDTVQIRKGTAPGRASRRCLAQK